MANYEHIEVELLQGLRDAVGALPHVSQVSLRSLPNPGGRYAPDGMLEVELGPRRLELFVEVKSELFPRDVRQQIWQLRDFLSSQESDSEQIAMLVAGSISRGARDILQQEMVGYFDPGGSLFIPSDGAYVLIDRPPAKKAERALGSIFQGQRARVVEAVIEAGQAWIGVKELAERTGVSPATASETMTEMERRDWLEVQGAGPAKLRRLFARAPLLDEWSRALANRKPPRMERYYVPARDAADIARQLDEACRAVGARYAVTAEAAAQAYAPYLTAISQLKCRIQGGRVRRDVLARLDARPVSEGWNLGVIDDAGSSNVGAGDRIDGIIYAGPVQVYLDLLQGSGRGKEMADHLRSQRLADQ